MNHPSNPSIYAKPEGKKYRKLIESFLHMPKYPFLSAVALRKLCIEHGLTKDYLDQILAFLKGVDWDVKHEVKWMAIAVAAEYLHYTDGKHPEILNLIKNISENPTEDSFAQEFAKEAVSRAQGGDWNEFRLLELVDPEEN